MPTRRHALARALALAFGLAASTALADEGVIEINQTIAGAGTVPGCDSPGFPVTICLPGTYRLTGPLINDPQLASTIEVFSSDVTLDLNGFYVRGSNSCSAGTRTSLPVCTAGQVGLAGVMAVGSPNLTVTNGTISGMRDNGIEAVAPGTRVAGVRVAMNGGSGMKLGPQCSVHDSSAVNNRFDGIYGEQGCVVAHNTVSGNLIGIEAIGDATIESNTVSGSVNGGIVIRSSGIAFGNDASANGFGIGSFGTGATGGANIHDNLMTGNTTGVSVNGNSARLSGNTIVGSVSDGIRVFTTGLPVLSGNVITGSGSLDISLVDPGSNFVQIGTNFCGTDIVCP